MRSMIAIAAVGTLFGAALVGCESSGSDRPYGLTGDEQMSYGQRQRYVDQKGHYRPEYAARRQEIRPVPQKD